MTAFENLIVQKYGGATLADPSLIKSVARRLVEQSKQGPLIVVVSAMGTTTNSLVDLARQVSRNPSRRELDMLLSVGERISMSLLSMAVQELGAKAISFTGSQAGIFTDDDHFNARIVDVRAHRVEDALRAGKIVILAGFQGVSPVTKEITTLGRGGSDVTAVAMAGAFKAKRCEILKDVSAVFTADPRLVPRARAIPRLCYEDLADMTFWGAKVLHYRSAELAREKRVPLYIGPAAHPAEGTIINESSDHAPHCPLSLNSHECVFEISLRGEREAALKEYEKRLVTREVPAPQILGWAGTQENLLRVTGPKEVLDPIREELRSEIRVDDLSSVTLTCAGGASKDVADRASTLLREHGIPTTEVIVGKRGLSAFLRREHREKALQILHDLIPSR